MFVPALPADQQGGRLFISRS